MRNPRPSSVPAHRRPLTFGNGNAKLDAAIFTFSLPAGYCCPFAKDCLSKADPATGRITDGTDTKYRCFSASTEARRSVRNARWHNANALRACNSMEEMAALILDSLSPFAGYVRVHVSGDFISQSYFDAWLEVARQRPRTVFYWYTKCIRYWVARLPLVGDGRTPGALTNVVPTASRGGRNDDLIDAHDLRSAAVVLGEGEAAMLGLELDYDDSHAFRHGPDYALLIHGTQPAGTPAAKAVSALRAQGLHGYGKSGRYTMGTV